MPVSSRVKILECRGFQEVEDKVNHFLECDKNIAQLVNIDYRLEFNIVIVEYNIIEPTLLELIKKKLDEPPTEVLQQQIQQQQQQSNNSNSNPFIDWWKLCFLPFSPRR